MCSLLLSVVDSPSSIKHSLLDDDTRLPISDETLDLSKTLHQIPTPSVESQTKDKNENKEREDILYEFDIINKIPDIPEDDDDIEFAELAAESLSKTSVVTVVPISTTAESTEGGWKAFEERLLNQINFYNFSTFYF